VWFSCLKSSYCIQRGKSGWGGVSPNSFPGLARHSNGFCRERDNRHRIVKMECLQAGRQRVVYLITYSRADVVKFLLKKVFPMLYYKLGRILALELYSG